MTLLGGYKKETAEMILEVVRYLKDSGYVIQRPGRGQQMLMPPESPIFVRNDADATLPAFGCVQVTGTYEQGGQNYITVDKPVDTTGEAGRYLFNSRAPVAAGEFGIAHDGPVVRMLTDGSPVVCGELWQPVVNSFLVSPGGNQFSAIGSDDIAADVMRGLILGGGDVGNNFIEFIVVSATTVADSGSPYNGMRKLVVTVKSPSCNIPGIWNTTVDVYEHEPLCLTGDETDGALVGRKGTAYQGVHQDMSSGAGTGDLTPCHYVLAGICCP